MSYHNRSDWSGFFVHFVCGAIIGAVLGFGIWVKSPEATSVPTSPGFFYIGGSALIIGLIAGFVGDRFWQSFGDWFRGW
jgi:hypothetical protein